MDQGRKGGGPTETAYSYGPEFAATALDSQQEGKLPHQK